MKEVDMKLCGYYVQDGAVHEGLRERLEAATESSPSINVHFPNLAVHDPDIIHRVQERLLLTPPSIATRPSTYTYAQDNFTVLLSHRSTALRLTPTCFSICPVQYTTNNDDLQPSSRIESIT